MKKKVILFLLFVTSGAVLAGLNTAVKLGQLNEELMSVRQEQEAVYKDYQTAIDLRRVAVRDGPPMMQHPDGIRIDAPQANLEDILHTQQEREAQIEQYTNDLTRLSARLLRLETQKNLLIKQIQELERQR